MYKHLSREERYQIYSLLKAKQTISQIARLLGRSRSTISRELVRGRGQRGYRAEQACAKASERAENSRNALRVQLKVWAEVNFYLGIQWSPEQIAGKVAVSHECVYLHVGAAATAGLGELVVGVHESTIYYVDTMLLDQRCRCQMGWPDAYIFGPNGSTYLSESDGQIPTLICPVLARSSKLSRLG